MNPRLLALAAGLTPERRGRRSCHTLHAGRRPGAVRIAAGLAGMSIVGMTRASPGLENDKEIVNTVPLEEPDVED